MNDELSTLPTPPDVFIDALVLTVAELFPCESPADAGDVEPFLAGRTEWMRRAFAE